MAEKKDLFVTWDEKDLASKEKAISKSNGSGKSFIKSVGASSYKNIEAPSISVREGFDRRDYDFFRPSEQIPVRDKEVMIACMQAYERIGIVRNTVDMMSEFACQGIDLVHPNEKIQKFYKEWFKKIRGKDRTERILNLLYRCGNVIIKRNSAVLNREEARRIEKGFAAQIKKDFIKPPKPLEVPWEYTIYNPTTIEVYGEEIAPFIGIKAFRFGVRLTDEFSKKLKSPKSEIEKGIIKALPSQLDDYAVRGGFLVPLDADKTIALYYKRDDWQVWAKPMLYPLLKDLQMLEKMKLADLAALDGAISHIRVWRLGSLEHRILPTEEAINRLADMLINNVGGGSMDLIWGPEIDLLETKTDLVSFLGEEKYRPILNSIYAGLGIPPSLTGLPTGGGVSNNYISLRTLIERLRYGRDVVTDFWEREVKLVQMAMGFKFPAQVVFDNQTLSDEAAEKRLLIELADRDLISQEAIQERFNLIPEIETVRLRRERTSRKEEALPPKASPFHSPQHKEAVEKIFVQTGILSPDYFGIKDPNPMPVIKNDPAKLKNDVPKGESGQGRPPGKMDSLPRRKKESKPTVATDFVDRLNWAEQTQKTISEILQPAYLKSVNKKSLRDLSVAQINDFEQVKFSILCKTEPDQKITKTFIYNSLKERLGIPIEVEDFFKTCIAKYVEKTGSLPTSEITRKIQASVYAMHTVGLQKTDNIDNPTSQIS
jgi:hypothetical protein